MITVTLHAHFGQLFGASEVTMAASGARPGEIPAGNHRTPDGLLVIHEPLNLRSVIQALISHCPSLGRYLLLLDDSAFRNNALVIYDGHLASSLDQPLGADSRIEVLPALIGG